jgi:hypothetical protein
LKTQAEQMKVQFGSALSDEAKSNAFITIPGLRGMAPKEISKKSCKHHPGTYERDHGFCNLSFKTGWP